MKKIYLIATVVAIIAGVATYFFASELKKNSTIKDVEKADVVIAAINIEENKILTADMFITREIPITAVAPGSVTKVTDLVGKMSIEPIYAGEQVLAKRVTLVADSALASRLSYRIEPGKYAYTISMDYNSTIGGFARVGDRLDIYLSGDPLKLLLEDVEIIKISSYAANSGATTTGQPEIKQYTDITVFLTRDEILKLGDVKNAGKFTMALVAYADAVNIVNDLIEDVTESEIQTNVGNIVTPPSEAAGAA